MDKTTFKDYIKTQLVADLHLSEDCVTCSPTDTILTVAQVLAKNKIGSILIVDEADQRKPLGIFTERDLIRCVANTELNLAAEPISKHMTANPKSVSKTTSLFTVMAAMRVGRFRHLVVTDEVGHLLGVISIRDIVVHLVDELS